MSSGKETPRQKMIGLMYLVLMAMLAMNVSKDVLDAFITVNGSLMQTQENSEIQNEMLFSEIQSAYALDAKKTQIQMDKAIEIRKHTKEMLQFIKELKKQVISETEKVSMEVADTIHMEFLNSKDNYDIPSHLMIGLTEDGSNGKSRELHNKIDAYKNSIQSYFTDKELETLKLGLELQGGKEGERELNWETYTFDHTPLIATVTILSKLEMDVINAEYSALNKLYSSIGKDDFPFDTIAAKVVSPTNYVLLGEEYKAEVFLAAFSTTQKPTIKLNNEELNVENGIGNYTVKATKEGIFDYKGAIDVMKKNGQVKTYPFESNYIVAKPSLTISPTKMNVLYIGIDNPISISVPGVANSNISAKSSHGKLKPTGDGTYTIKPPVSGAPDLVDINVSAQMNDGTSKSMGKMQFRLKRIPDPKVRIMGRNENFVFKPLELKQMKKLNVVYGEDFLFDGSANMVSCSMRAFVNGKPIETSFKKGVLNADAKKILSKVKKGDIITFNNITIKGMDGGTRRLQSVTVEVR